MNVYKIILIIGISLSPLLLYSQYKQEVEQRLAKIETPSFMVDFASKIEGAKKIKYYQETDGSVVSYELKFCKNKERYSVEFSKEGILEDVEIDVTSTQGVLVDSFICNDFTIDKIQEHHPVDVDKAILLCNGDKKLRASVIMFEIEGHCRSSNENTRWELNVDKKGVIHSQREIIDDVDEVLEY